MMLVAYFMFSLVDTSVKWLLVLGFAPLQLAFLRYVGQMVICTLLAMRDPGHVWPARGDLGLTLLRSAALVVSTIGNFIALLYLPLTITSAIMFTAPILVCLLSMPVLGERVGPWRWGAILLGFLGVTIIIQPFGTAFHWASVLALFNALCMAVYSILTRMLANRVRRETLQFWTGALGTLVLLPLALLSWTPPTGLGVLALWAGLGLFAWTGHEFLTRAHRDAPANALMPFSYSLLIFMSGFDAVLFGETPSPTEAAGIFIIVLSGLIIWKRGR